MIRIEFRTGLEDNELIAFSVGIFVPRVGDMVNFKGTRYSVTGVDLEYRDVLGEGKPSPIMKAIVWLE